MATVQSYLLLTLLLLSVIKCSQALAEMSADESNADVEDERRDYDFDKLRRFLLTANAEERAAKREQQDYFKRELIRDYFQASRGSDSKRFQEVRKRFKTYCNSYEDLMNSNWATCG